MRALIALDPPPEDGGSKILSKDDTELKKKISSKWMVLFVAKF